ncbi:DDE-type integrase/transposase/recombinase [Flavobacterium sp.]|uniref:DDE-type integrase/transposase/recombinase n=1 Tax=Flavobacterium sp. TaxID=239 RepID=UPI003750984F
MSTLQIRRSWDTNVKIYVRNGLHKNLSKELLQTLHPSNISRWQKESENKYQNVGLQSYITKDLALIQEQNEFPSSKKLSWAYIKLLKGAYEVFNQIKDFNKTIKANKQIIVNTVEAIKSYIPTAEAIKLFRISRATYQNYKIQVLNKCDASYVFWCVKRYPQQLLNKEILKIKGYFENPDYQFWSKSSLYYLGLRNQDFGFCLATFYKYAKLLGFNNGRHLQNKPQCTPLVSTKPNQIWCADITIHKTNDGVKHYIHLLIDHYSRMILGWKVDTKANPKIIKSLLENAFQKLPNPATIEFVTDAGVENVNATVQEFVASTGLKIIHQIAQRDILSSNSTIEAVNKTLKYQYFYKPHLLTSSLFLKELPFSINNYCTVRPQHSLRGNTPFETYHGKGIAVSQYNSHFEGQKQLRKTQNHLNRCKKCMS